MWKVISSDLDFILKNYNNNKATNNNNDNDSLIFWIYRVIRKWRNKQVSGAHAWYIFDVTIKYVAYWNLRRVLKLCWVDSWLEDQLRNGLLHIL